ncbi:MAG: fatty acid--CoA ligase family protein [Pseudomonadota bacterium]|nr:fatty acid--CoA ligase family protein [Pseudomonadota bacterium]
MAARVAGDLEDRGLRSDEPVLVTIGNRPSDLGTLLGVWLAGAVAVPIHRSAAKTTLNSLREATGARFLIDGNEVTGLASAPPPARALLRGAALIIFTSGSTGQPKGVVVGHEPLSGKLDVLDRLLRFRAEDLIVVPLQLTFIFGIWASLLTLRSGATLVLVPRFSAEAMAGALDEGGSVLVAVPSMLRTMLSDVRRPAPSLRSILSGGEVLGAALAGAIQDAFPSAGIYDLYGLTETGSCDFCLRPSDQPVGLGTIGSPTDHVEFRLAGEHGGSAPQGAPGELQIRTPFRMLGYLDNPDLTRAAFSDGFFKTGDIARQRSDGRIELVGRSKEIISRGGNKIAPLELDNLLSSHPDVAAALCAGVPEERLGEAIHAVVVVRPGASLTPEELRAWAAARIERFKLPDVIHFRDALPMGHTGKASRSAISEIAAARATS